MKVSYRLYEFDFDVKNNSKLLVICNRLSLNLSNFINKLAEKLSKEPSVFSSSELYNEFSNRYYSLSPLLIKKCFSMNSNIIFIEDYHEVPFINEKLLEAISTSQVSLIMSSENSFNKVDFDYILITEFSNELVNQNTVKSFMKRFSFDVNTLQNFISEVTIKGYYLIISNEKIYYINKKMLI